MTMLVGLAETKARIRFDHDAEDQDITFLIEQASRMILNYLKTDESFFAGSDDEDSDGFYPTDTDGVLLGVTDEVRAATMYLVGIIKRDPDGAESDKWPAGSLPAPITAMLHQLRDPALA